MLILWERRKDEIGCCVGCAGPLQFALTLVGFAGSCSGVVPVLVSTVVGGSGAFVGNFLNFSRCSSISVAVGFSLGLRCLRVLRNVAPSGDVIQ